MDLEIEPNDIIPVQPFLERLSELGSNIRVFFDSPRGQGYPARESRVIHALAYKLVDPFSSLPRSQRDASIFVPRVVIAPKHYEHVLNYFFHQSGKKEKDLEVISFHADKNRASIGLHPNTHYNLFYSLSRMPDEYRDMFETYGQDFNLETLSFGKY